MNALQAKQIPLDAILSAKGFQPQYTKGHELWYSSPLRQEKTPSFKIDTRKNVWFDFGLQAGGNVFDLFKHLYHETHISRVLMMLENFSHTPYSQLSTQTPLPLTLQKTKRPLIHSVREIEHLSLTRYLQSRCIDLSRAKRYLSEIHYQVGERHYFALGHANQLGGFELRSPHFKGSLQPKSWSVFTGESQQTGQLAIFEGMFDFLSLLQLHNKEVPPYDSIVLNSLGLWERMLSTLTQEAYSTFSLYLDNDSAGKQATAQIQVLLQDSEVIDQSPHYATHKDINEYLIHTQEKQRDLNRTLQESDPFILQKVLTREKTQYE